MIYGRKRLPALGVLTGYRGGRSPKIDNLIVDRSPHSRRRILTTATLKISYVKPCDVPIPQPPLKVWFSIGRTSANSR